MPICPRCGRMLSTADTRKSRRKGEGRVCKDGVRCHRALSEGKPATEVAGEKSSVEVALTRAGLPSESTPGPESISQTPRPHRMERTKDAASAVSVASVAAPSLSVSRPAPVPAAAHIDDERVDKQFALSPLRERELPLA